MKTPTVPELKKWAKDMKPLAEAVCLAQAFAEVERERVDAYIEPLFLSFGFTNDMDSPRNTHKGEPLTESKRIYLSTDEEKVKAFFAESDKLHRQHAPKWDGPEGNCPALEAESLLREVQQALLDEVAKLVGLDSIWVTLEQRAKTLDWALTVCLGKLT